MLSPENCWEFKRCGREPGGANAELGVCPAATVDLGWRVNGGAHAGRYCWAVPNTLCEDAVQGTVAEKSATCLNCDFLRHVQREMGSAFIMFLP